MHLPHAAADSLNKAIAQKRKATGEAVQQQQQQR
jgi:hypothetical protein